MGFDYLRDNMVLYKEQKVQRGHNFAIVDEVDSILIDEARTPLIISGRGDQSTDLYRRANDFARTLKMDKVAQMDEKQDTEDTYDGDFVVDEKARTATLTQRGVKKAEEYFGVENLMDMENTTLLHHINQAIKAIGVIEGDGRDMSGMVALPGFVDIHIHGAAGGDASDADEAGLEKIGKYLAKHGVTSFCPTSMTLGRQTLCDIVSTVKNYKGRESGAKVAGINLEGPFIAMSKKGAQNPEFVRPGTAEEFDGLFDKSGGLVKLITIAPEAFDSAEFIKHASKKCSVSIGHSAANAAEAQAAFDLGANHATHLYNAMTPMQHREAGIAGTALDNENVYCELICDGGHICPAVLRNTFKMLGKKQGVRDFGFYARGRARRRRIRAWRSACFRARRRQICRA